MTLAEARQLQPGDVVRHRNRSPEDRFVVLQSPTGPVRSEFGVEDYVNVLVTTVSPKGYSESEGWKAWSHLLTEVSPYEGLELGPDQEEANNNG